MTGHKRRLGKALRAALGLAAATGAAVALLAPTAPMASASPESEASDAITAAWEAAGGEESALGAPQGEVYPVGDGFAEDFAGGKMYFTPATGARALSGPMLDKYQALGGAAGDLGFPDSDETAGLAGPDSRFITFAAADKPVMYFTAEHGAYVVRGAINVAWDKLGSSSGALGVPVADEAFQGDVVSQQFSDGRVSWNRTTKAFTAEPAELTDQLKDLQVPFDATTAIDWSWRATGGVSGPLGAKQGGQYPVGNDGLGQDFVGGKIFYTPATGANAVSGDILAKYESLGGPAGSDLGFPAANVADGDIPGSRISTFAGAGQPVIFWTPEHGAFVVRDAMKAAWDKLGGAGGKLGVPVGDQAVDGDVVSQKFTGGTVSWNRMTERFSSEPGDLASSLSGLQVPGGSPSGAPASASGHRGWLSWHWWWLAAAAGVLALVGVLAMLWWRRRRVAERFLMRRNGQRRVRVPVGTKRLARENGAAAADRGPADSTERLAEYLREPLGTPSSAHELDEPATDDFWSVGVGDTADADEVGDAAEVAAAAEGAEFDGEYSDDVDTAPTRIPSAAEVATGRHATADVATPAESPAAGQRVYPAIHLPLDDPYQQPEGYPVKVNTLSGLYYTPDNALYDDTLADLWFVNDEVAQYNGFIRAR